MSKDPMSQREHSVRRLRVSSETADRIVSWTAVSVLATQILSVGWLAPPLTRYVVVFVAMVLAQAGFLSVAFRLGIRGQAEGVGFQKVGTPGA